MAGTIGTLILTSTTAAVAKFPPFPYRRHQHRRHDTFPPLSTNHRHHLSLSVSFNHNRITHISASQRPKNDGVSGPGTDWAKPGLAFASNNFLPLALIGGVILGVANPSLGCLADKYYLSKFSTFAIFIISGLTLRNGEIGAAVEAWPVGVFGLCSILFFTPYFSRIILQVQLQPQEFVTGLALFSCMPTTLSSGVALTQLAGGNSALALTMTVISNLLGILIVPFSISGFIATGVGISVPTKQLFRSLVLTLLIPLIMGKVLRESSKGLANFVDQNHKLFSKISALFLSLVPWIQVSKSRSLLLMVKPSVFLVAILMGALMHLILLAFNALSVKGLSAISGNNQSIFSKKENSTALVLVASQKTLPVLVAVVEQLGGAFGKSGLLVLPCVAAHLIQIIMDSFLVNSFLQPALKNAKVQIVSDSEDRVSFKRL